MGSGKVSRVGHGTLRRALRSYDRLLHGCLFTVRPQREARQVHDSRGRSECEEVEHNPKQTYISQD
jgi:hypothetical protein